MRGDEIDKVIAELPDRRMVELIRKIRETDAAMIEAQANLKLYLCCLGCFVVGIVLGAGSMS